MPLRKNARRFCIRNPKPQLPEFTSTVCPSGDGQRRGAVTVNRTIFKQYTALLDFSFASSAGVGTHTVAVVVVNFTVADIKSGVFSAMDGDRYVKIQLCGL